MNAQPTMLQRSSDRAKGESVVASSDARWSSVVYDGELSRSVSFFARRAPRERVASKAQAVEKSALSGPMSLRMRLRRRKAVIGAVGVGSLRESWVVR